MKRRPTRPARRKSPRGRRPRAPYTLERLSRRRRQEISRLGGRARAAKWVGHWFRGEAAVAAGRKGGQKLLRRRGKAYFREIGRKGGLVKAADRRRSPLFRKLTGEDPG